MAGNFRLGKGTGRGLGVKSTEENRVSVTNFHMYDEKGG